VSEYQYYEFLAVDRLLDAKARAQLRAISSRARITASSFVNSYDWGDLKADPLQLLERYFDLHLYLANWGTRQLAMKFPRRLLEIEAVRSSQSEEGLLLLRPAGENVILSILREEIDTDDWDDGSGWLAALAPLRAELLAGDLRLLPLLWLIEVGNEWVEDDALEPAPGLGSLTPPLAALAEFLQIDPDLLEAATGSAAVSVPAEPSPGEVEAIVRGLPEDEKVALLLRVHAGDAHVGAELQRRCRPSVARAAELRSPRRTAGDLRAVARRIEEKRHRLAAEKAAAEQRRVERAAALARAKRLQALAGREEKAWHDAEALIGQRNSKGYDQAAALLADLGALADSSGAYETFAERLAELRGRHSAKRQFIGRLDTAGLVARRTIC
jgi:hypothetical protein